MTIEEQLEDLKNQVEATNAKNKELLTELKTARNKNKEVDTEAYYKTLDEVDNLKAENAKLNQTLGLKSKEVEKLSTTLNELDTNLKTTKLENTLNEELSKLGLNPILSRYVKNDFKALSKINEDGSISIADKPLKEYVSEWLNTDEGKAVSLPSGNVGTSASGGSNNSGVSEAKYFDRNSKEFNLTKQAEVYHTNPTLYNQLKGN